ncbi:MAG TPA: MarR family transcriptional regulator [Chloroflexota bacterium]
MEDERDALVRHVMAIDKRLYNYMLSMRIPDWASIELTMPQMKVLFLGCGPRPLRSSQVARALGMTLSTATGVVDRLVAQGLVQRHEDPSDRRVVLLSATPAGRAMLDRLLSAGLGHLRQILDCLTVEQLRVVATGIDLLCEAATRLPAPRAAGASLPWDDAFAASGEQASVGGPGAIE